MEESKKSSLGKYSFKEIRDEKGEDPIAENPTIEDTPNSEDLEYMDKLEKLVDEEVEQRKKLEAELEELKTLFKIVKMKNK